MKILLYTSIVLTLWHFFACADIINQHCEDGWTFHSQYCYITQQEYESFDQAETTCDLMGGLLAYGKNADSIAFLKKLIDGKQLYGWWYGVQVSSENVPFTKGLYGYYTTREENLALPDDRSFDPPSSGCVGYQYYNSYYNRENIMTSVPCEITLPYICRGNITNNKDKAHYVNSSSDMFYFSPPNDKRSFQDATKACTDKQMTLASIRDSVQKKFIDAQIKSRGMDNSDPWWIGVTIKNGYYTWSNGVKIQAGILKWKRNARSRAICRLLLFDGTLEAVDCRNLNAPFICAKYAHDKEEFGCPVGWNRGGQSCYFRGSQRKYAFHDDAQRLCSKMNSHLVSIDSRTEKIWLFENFMRSSNGFWTSLNDVAKKGEYVWADGSAPLPNILIWDNDLFSNAKCAIFYGVTNTVTAMSCDYINYPGCQYVTPNNKCVSKNWVYSDGNCYFKPSYISQSLFVSQPTMLHVCYEDLAKYDTSIKIFPLKIDSKGVLEVFKGFQRYVWTGLKVKAGGSFEWADGSPVDMSLFSNTQQPDPGTEDKPKHCTFVDKNGYFKTDYCTKSRTTQMFVCEKEVEYRPESKSK